MDFMNCKDGLLTINSDGEPIVLSVGHSVTLIDERGLRLFAHKWDREDETTEYQQSFRVEDIIDNALVLTCNDFTMILALQTGLDEPCVDWCDGESYSHDRILTVPRRGDGTHWKFNIEPGTLPPEKKDTKALAA